MTAAEPAHIVENPEQAALLLDPLRQLLLEHLRTPSSASMLSRELGLPRQKIGYHLRELEKAGLVELVEERRKRNCVERVVRACADSFVISPAALGRLGVGPDLVRDRFSWSSLLAAASRVIRDLGALRRQSVRAGQQLPTLALELELRIASLGHQVAFAQELREEIGRVVAKYDRKQTAGGQRFRFLAAVYPGDDS